MDFVRQGILEEPISREVCEAVKSNQKCKSPGEDRIINEVWKTHDFLVEGAISLMRVPSQQRGLMAFLSLYMVID